MSDLTIPDLLKVYGEEETPMQTINHWITHGLNALHDGDIESAMDVLRAAKRLVYQTANQYEPKYVVPMYESERGWGSKIDGYAGPFDTLKGAADFRAAYNKKHNSAAIAPSWYILAMEPVPFTNQKCDYKTEVSDD